MSLQLTIACGDYDRTHPLIDGSIKPEGIELNWLVLPHLEIWTRMLNYYDFDASEISLSSYLIARTIGKPLTAIPVFPARAFRHSYIFINTKSGIREPKDLMGKRSAWRSFNRPRRSGCGELCSMNTASISTISNGTPGRRTHAWRWSCRNATKSPISRRTESRTRCFSTANSTRSCAESVSVAVESAAAYPPFVRRLRGSRSEYFKKTGIFPIMHSVALRQEVWEKHPWIAQKSVQGVSASERRCLCEVE